MTDKASMPLSLDPETVTLLRETLDDAWSCLRPEQQATMQKTALAVRILKSAAQGERDRERLRDAALDLARRLSGHSWLKEHFVRGGVWRAERRCAFSRCIV